MNEMPNSTDDWTDWVSALIVNLPLEQSAPAIGNQAIYLAQQLLAAIEQGGIPTDPIRINNIGRALGLEVSNDAPMAQTINCIRAIVNKT